MGMGGGLGMRGGRTPGGDLGKVEGLMRWGDDATSCLLFSGDTVIDEICTAGDGATRMFFFLVLVGEFRLNLGFFFVKRWRLGRMQFDRIFHTIVDKDDFMK